MNFFDCASHLGAHLDHSQTRVPRYLFLLYHLSDSHLLNQCVFMYLCVCLSREIAQRGM